MRPGGVLPVRHEAVAALPGWRVRCMSRADFADGTAGVLRLHVRLTPRGGADRIEGVGEVGASGSVLLARVRAVPEKGLANAALLQLIAEAGGWPKSALRLDTGSRSRVKVVTVSGDPGVLAEGLARLRAALEHRPSHASAGGAGQARRWSIAGDIGRGDVS